MIFPFLVNNQTPPTVFMSTKEICDQIKDFIRNDLKPFSLVDGNSAIQSTLQLDMNITKEPCERREGLLCFEIENRNQLKEILECSIEGTIGQDPMIVADQTLEQNRINSTQKFYLSVLRSKQQ